MSDAAARSADPSRRVAMRSEDLVVAIDASAIHARSGGVARYLEGLLGSLPRQGLHAHVVLQRTNADQWGGELSVQRLAPRSPPLRLLWEQTRLLSCLRELQPVPTVLHSPHYTMPERLGRRGVRSRPARVVTIHDLTFFSHPQAHAATKRVLFRRAIRVAAERADALICVSRATAEELANHVSVRVPVHVVPHGVDHARFRPEPRPDDAGLRSALGIERPYVLHVGAIEPRKNVAALASAYERIARLQHDVDLVLVGQPWPGERVPAVAAGRVRHLGFVPDRALCALLRGAAAVAYPSLAEGFGLPVLEALACGAAVVTSRLGATAEVAGDAAVLVDPHDIDSIAQGLLDAVEQRGPRREQRIARAAEFTWARSAEAHVNLYRELGSVG